MWVDRSAVRPSNCISDPVSWRMMLPVAFCAEKGIHFCYTMSLPLLQVICFISINKVCDDCLHVGFMQWLSLVISNEWLISMHTSLYDNTAWDNYSQPGLVWTQTLCSVRRVWVQTKPGLDFRFRCHSSTAWNWLKNLDCMNRKLKACTDFRIQNLLWELKTESWKAFRDFRICCESWKQKAEKLSEISEFGCESWNRKLKSFQRFQNSDVTVAEKRIRSSRFWFLILWKVESRMAGRYTHRRVWASNIKAFSVKCQHVAEQSLIVTLLSTKVLKSLEKMHGCRDQLVMRWYHTMQPFIVHLL